MTRTNPHRHPVRLGLAVLAAFVALTALSGCQFTAKQQEVRNAMNADRRANGRGDLAMHVQAAAKAQAWAEKLARDGKLSHSNLPSGISVRWCSLGENVGMGNSVASIEKAYMNSPGHRANIVSTTWNGVGTGHATKNGVTYTVQVFIKTC